MAEALAVKDFWSRVYPEEGLLDCPLCYASFWNKKTREKHVREAHNLTSQRWLCSVCGGSFPTWRVTLLENTHLPQRSQTAIMTRRENYRLEAIPMPLLREDPPEVEDGRHQGTSSPTSTHKTEACATSHIFHVANTITTRRSS